MINNCKGVLFDFNGTLFFDSDKHVLAWGKLSEDLRGVGISSEELQTHFYGVPNNRAIEYLIQRSCPEEELSAYSERKEAYYRDFCSQDKERFHLVKGANAFFSKLQEQGIPRKRGQFDEPFRLANYSPYECSAGCYFVCLWELSG